MMQVAAFFHKYSKRITLGVTALAVLILASWWALPNAPQPADTANTLAEDPLLFPDEATPAPAAPTAAPLIVAYISGAVQTPDVYQLPAEARVKDLVVAAGGLMADADAEQINLAERIADGQHIRVPYQGEPSTRSADPAPSGSAAAQPDAPTDLNTASADELDKLEGIGKVLAQRIIDYRTANGPFKSVDELSNVKGISATLLSKLAPRLNAGP